MLLPIGDTPNPRNFQAWVTWGLMAANIVIFALITLPLAGVPIDPRDPLLQDYVNALAPELGSRGELVALLRSMSQYDLVVFEHGYRPGSPEVADLFSSMFLHGGFAHLAGNMLFLWIFGRNVEHRMGRLPFLFAYLSTGAVATLSFGVLAGHSQVPLVGASGAISGVLGVYFLAFPRNKVKLFLFFFPFFNVFLVPSRWVLGFYVLVDNLLPLLIGANSGVAYGAHLGGFVGGLALAGAGRLLSWRFPWVRNQVSRANRRVTLSDRLEIEGHDPLEILRGAIHDADRELAMAAVRHVYLSDLGGLYTDESLKLAAWLVELGHLSAAERVIRQVTGKRDAPSSDVARALLALGLIRLHQGQTASGHQYLSKAVELDADDDVTRRAREALGNVPLSRSSRG